MKVKWNGKMSESRHLPGGGAMGSTLGVWEYLSQSNASAFCVPEEDRFKFVDDLTIIEVINLINIGLSSLRNQVPSDLPVGGYYLESNKLNTQHYLQEINKSTENQKMIISQQKTKSMIFNFSSNYKFTTRLQLKEENIQLVDQMKILGTIVNSNLSWNENTQYLIRRVNSRMQLIRNLIQFGASKYELVHLWSFF